jgi:hypothetical protein
MAKMDLFSNKLSFAKTPIEVPDFKIEILWEARNDQHQKNQWLREQVKNTITGHVSKLRQS